MSATARPCPCCGGKADSNFSQTVCTVCGLRVAGLHHLQRWNRRQPPTEPDEEAQRTPLLTLARLVGANVYGSVDGESADPHYAMRLVDGLYDTDPHVQGALDGLQVAQNMHLWRLEELSRDQWHKAGGFYYRDYLPAFKGLDGGKQS